MKRYGLSLGLALFCTTAFANDIRISQLQLVNRDTSAGFVQLQFDMSWDNSWRLPATLSPANRDAAWVFAKFRVGFVNPNFSVASAAASATVLEVSSTDGLRVGMPLRIISGSGALASSTRIVAINAVDNEITLSTGVTTALSNAVLEAERIWEHAWLHETGHQAASGSVLHPALPDESAAFDALTNPVVGVFVYRSGPGSGNFDATDIQLRWNYRDQGLDDNDIVDVRVFGLEMVYVPGANYFVGSGGTEAAGFTAANSTSGNTASIEITATPPVIQGNDASSSDENLSARGNIDLIGTATASLASGFPFAQSAYYLMKHELSQQAYADFLNTLSREQQQARTASNLAIGETSVTNRYVMSGSASLQNRNGIRCNASIDAQAPINFYCDLSGNGTGGEADDGMFIACNYLSWADLAAYFDWAALRPMTELEYEKASRGTGDPTAGAYAWGTAAAVQATGVSQAGARDEQASNGAANAVFGNAGGLQGPLRVGAFASEESSAIAAGSSPYGILELSGNLNERCVSIGNAAGRAFTGLHGDGMLNNAGDADVSQWPDQSGGGAGFRGGGWADSAAAMELANRSRAAETSSTRASENGGRAARSQPALATISGGAP
ncbi:MAG: SUMF1/EgtB/PvdO family nonheme iron enzyme [Bacteroidia bacterium]